jgi:hypothetical protein
VASHRQDEMERIWSEARSLDKQMQVLEGRVRVAREGPDVAAAMQAVDSTRQRAQLRATLARLELAAAQLQGKDPSVETWQQELEHGTAMVRVSAATAAEEAAGEPAEPTETLRAPSYFVGRKIVSESEIDDVVKSYYRWTEASLNLVLPTFALGFAIYLSSSKWGSWTLTIAVASTIVLFRVARRRHQDYRNRLRGFIEGRLKSYQEESLQKEKAKTMDEVVQEAKKLLAEAQKSKEPAHSGRADPDVGP